MTTWMITGTSSGFGKELAKLVAKSSDNLIATARKLSDLDYLDQYDQAKIKKLVLDVTHTADIKPAVKEANSTFDGIDVLVNNAGLGYFSTIEESDMQQVRYMFDVNVFGLANVTNAVLPILRNQKSGMIINLSSALGLTTLPTMGFYSATKYAVEGYSDALRQEVGSLGIQVMAVEPSGARTDWSGRSSDKVVPKIKDYQQFDKMIETTDNGVDQAPGDLALIAKVIVDEVHSGHDLPHHLPLGNFAVDGSLKNLNAIVEEIKANEKLSRSVDNK